MWVAAVAYLYEFVLTKMGKNSDFMEEFYTENSDDLYVLIVYSACVFALYWSVPKPYSTLNLDLGLLGVPYLIYVMLTLYKCASIKVAGHTLPKQQVKLFIVIIGGLYIGSFLIFYLIQTDDMNERQSLWWQITIFSTSVFTFIASRLLLFYLKKGRLEPSPIWVDMLRTIKFASGLYAALAAATPEWNNYVKKEKTRLRKEEARKRKKGRK